MKKNIYIYKEKKYKFLIDTTQFFFLDKEKGGRGRPYVTYSSGRDLIGAPPLGNVGLSHSYCDRDATDLTLAPQESQSVDAMQAMKFLPPHMVPTMTRTRDNELAHGIPHRWVTPLEILLWKYCVHNISKKEYMYKPMWVILGDFFSKIWAYATLC